MTDRRDQGVGPADRSRVYEPLLAVDRQRYQDDLQFIAASRPPGSDHWRAVQELCVTRFAALGYSVERQDYGTGVNVLGRKLGRRAPREQVVLSAHYDSVADCAGADDNGSGVAGLLEAARILARLTPSRTLLLACWDGEEAGTIGSAAYVEAAQQRGDAIVVAYVNEMIGFSSREPNTQQLPLGLGWLFPTEVAQIAENHFRGDFIAVVFDEHASGASQRAASAMAAAAHGAGLALVGLQVPRMLKVDRMLADLRRSDHAPFWEADYPALMITDTANFRNTRYHCANGPDTVEALDHAFAAAVIEATVASAQVMLEGG
ncbi:MAG: M20/M25/M40 family metallo-hydrolase [Proteobacteria bacterium]|nr:M20/M25/M40 family metallo-hydrolase [Pseudomonadota bacterium]